MPNRVGMGRAQRVDERYQIKLSVELVAGKRRTPLSTEDVSFSGMFLRTDSPPPMRGLVRLDVPLADEGRTLQLHAMVVHVLAPDNPWGRTPGIGLRFYGIDRHDREAWIRFVNRFKNSEPRRAGGGVIANSNHAAHAAPAQRYAAVLEIKVPTVDDLDAFYKRDILRGGTFLYTDFDVEEGQELFLEIVHPDTHELFGIKSRIVRRVLERGTQGVGVEFVDFDEAKREEFWSFVHTAALPLEDDDIMIVEDSDLWVDLSPETVRAAAAMEPVFHRSGGY